MAKVSFALLACLLLLFVIAISEVAEAAEPTQCKYPSKTYKGPCGEKDTAKCGETCKKEKATNMNGNCQKDGTCQCLYDCAKGPPSVHTKTAHPGKATIKPAVTTTTRN